MLAAGGWRLIFLVNVPVGIVGTAAAWVFVPRSRDLQDRARFDWIGLSLFVPTIVALLVIVSFGGQWGWTSAPTIALILPAASAGTGFIAFERRCAEPMLDLSLFSRSQFATGVVSGLLAYAVLFGTMFLVPFFLVRARGTSSAHVGLELAVLPLALGCFAPIAGKMAEHVGTRWLTAVGMTLTSAMLALVGLSQPSGALLIGQLGLVGAGIGLFIAAEQRRHHGQRAPGAGRHGRWGAEHDPGPRHCSRAGTHWSRLRRGRRRSEHGLGDIKRIRGRGIVLGRRRSGRGSPRVRPSPIDLE